MVFYINARILDIGSMKIAEEERKITEADVIPWLSVN